MGRDVLMQHDVLSQLANDQKGFVLRLRFNPPGLAACGELDCAAAPIFTAAAELLSAGCAVDLVVDLSGVTSVDAAGLHAVQTVQQRVAGAGGAVELRGVRPPVRRSMLCCGLSWLLTDCVDTTMVHAGGTGGTLRDAVR